MIARQIAFTAVADAGAIQDGLFVTRI